LRGTVVAGAVVAGTVAGGATVVVTTGVVGGKTARFEVESATVWV
jgi:3-oxoacyl-ACP reductase-like protein